mmetsp:Transcript_28762/g.52412  ORF Transcript_28762/g.52412 Transcript_28762/m.52412 type:complete len:449 (+) Transcript_28762:59-1405(+)
MGGNRLIRNVVIAACALDAADKVLLGSVYKALTLAMRVGPRELGALTFAQNVALSAALPFWGSLVGTYDTKTLMAMGCWLWAGATFLLACSTHFWAHFLLRLVNGAALAVMNPIGQAIICEVVPEGERGWAFGLLGSVNSACVMVVGFMATAMSTHVYLGLQGWRWAHIAVSLMSYAMSLMLWSVNMSNPASVEAHSAKAVSWLAEQKRIVIAVLKKPSFIIMVTQGVTGGIPWNAFSFLTYYFQLSGYSDLEAASITSYGGAGSIFGTLLGGWLGDRLGRLWPDGGRIVIAQLSVLLGIVSFVVMMQISTTPGQPFLLTMSFFVFSMLSCWTQSAALRPICGEIFADNKDRAQVVALWIALEGLVSSVLGAPLVGVLSEAFGFTLSPGQVDAGVADQNSIVALRHALFGVAILPWVACLLAWFPMYWTYPRDRVHTAQTPAESKQGI